MTDASGLFTCRLRWGLCCVNAQELVPIGIRNGSESLPRVVKSAYRFGFKAKTANSPEIKSVKIPKNRYLSCNCCRYIRRELSVAARVWRIAAQKVPTAELTLLSTI